MNRYASTGTFTLWLGLTLLGIAGGASIQAQTAVSPSHQSALRQALCFYASFDGTTNATFAKGDRTIYTIMRQNPSAVTQPGIHTDGKTQLAPGHGLEGDALRFTDREARWVYYKANRNLPYADRNWSGSVSFWLKVDPQKELAPGYCDPIQITTRAWNDAAFFVDFDKEGDPRDFRLGVFPDLKAWNPDNRDVNGIPESERPLLKVTHPPFAGDKWTHVLFTWEKFNTGGKDGRATLYLNGRRQGDVTGWNQSFTWKETEEARLMIGLNYIGLMDEMACFDRALTEAEVKEVQRLGGAVRSLILPP